MKTVGGPPLDVNVNGSTVTAGNAPVTATDLATTDMAGYVHVVSAVIYPLPPSVADAVSNTASLSTLLAALQKAELVEIVGGLTDVTIFAPTDEAFNKSGIVVADTAKETLIEVLTYHVVNNTRAFSTDLVDGQKVPTVEGSDLTVTIDGSSVMINDANVAMANVLVSTGVVHVIDAVLVLPTPDTTPSPSSAFRTGISLMAALTVAMAC